MKSRSAIRLLIPLLLLLVLAVEEAHAQKEDYVWPFGMNYSLDFNFTPPRLEEQSVASTTTSAGTSSFSDPETGRLLFYTDGKVLWNRVHEPMPNGIGFKPDNPATVQTLIIQHPTDRSLFYVFFADESFLYDGQANPPRGISYCMVDLRLDSGRGDVTGDLVRLSAQNDRMSNKLSAIGMCDGSSYWIISHGINNNVFYAWKLDSDSLHHMPVLSDVGSVHSTLSKYPTGVPYCPSGGLLSASPDGEKLACVVYDGNCNETPNFEIFKFDAATGLLSQDILLLPWDAAVTYDACFSPDSKKLYTATYDTLFQYDVSNWSAPVIRQSLIAIPIAIAPGGVFLGQLKLGPDEKIYVNQGKAISVINNPNAAGVACDFVYGAYTTTHRSWHLSNHVEGEAPGHCGLPDARIGSYHSVCHGDFIVFRDSSVLGAETRIWTFEGGIPLTSTEKNPEVKYDQPGIFRVQLIVSNEAGLDTTFS